MHLCPGTLVPRLTPPGPGSLTWDGTGTPVQPGDPARKTTKKENTMFFSSTDINIASARAIAELVTAQTAEKTVDEKKN